MTKRTYHKPRESAASGPREEQADAGRRVKGDRREQRERDNIMLLVSDVKRFDVWSEDKPLCPYCYCLRRRGQALVEVSPAEEPEGPQGATSSDPGDAGEEGAPDE